MLPSLPSGASTFVLFSIIKKRDKGEQPKKKMQKLTCK